MFGTESAFFLDLLVKVLKSAMCSVVDRVDYSIFFFSFFLFSFLFESIHVCVKFIKDEVR